MELVFLAPKWLSTQEPLHFRRKFELVVVSLQLSASVILAQEQWGSGRARSTLPAVQKTKQKRLQSQLSVAVAAKRLLPLL